MNERPFLSRLRTWMVAVALLVMALVFGANSAAAQCPDYWVNINYLVPAPFSGPVDIETHWSNGMVINHSFSNDGHFTFSQDRSWGPLVGVSINGIMVYPGQKIKVPYPGMPPGMCIEIEVRFDSKGCLEIRMQPQGC